MMNASFTIQGNIVDIPGKRIYPGSIKIKNGEIAQIREDSSRYSTYILPGFIDAHIHIESSMLIPSEFARLAVVHGTVGTVSDPHEIANILGMEGIDFMIRNGKETYFKFFFGAPSCVPASPFETSGAVINPSDIETLLSRQDILYLSEMMNYPGVLSDNPEILAKINAAKKYSKPIDGHAPMLRGENLKKYISAGISTDHETSDLEEAREKLNLGMKILIRDGSAARDGERLYPLLNEFPDLCMFCSDDRHPDDLAEGHINLMVKDALKSGADLFSVLKAACLNPVKHYSLNTGLLREGDPADFIIVDDPVEFNIIQTFINGVIVAEGGKSLLPSITVQAVNKFHARPISVEDLQIIPKTDRIRVIRAYEGSLLTGCEICDAPVRGKNLISDPERDILKIVVLNRYRRDAYPAVGFVKGFGLKKGALASSIAHDSHNILAVGVSDAEIAAAINAIMENKGGIAVTEGNRSEILALPVAGIMTHRDGYEVAQQYKQLNTRAQQLGTSLNAPFMTLSFLALTVIPELKLSDMGLFDSSDFKFVNLFVE